MPSSVKKGSKYFCAMWFDVLIVMPGILEISVDDKEVNGCGRSL